MLTEAMNKTDRVSIYAGVPRQTAINLMEINLKNRRENDLYAFQ